MTTMLVNKSKMNQKGKTANDPGEITDAEKNHQ